MIDALFRSLCERKAIPPGHVSSSAARSISQASRGGGPIRAQAVKAPFKLCASAETPWHLRDNGRFERSTQPDTLNEYAKDFLEHH